MSAQIELSETNGSTPVVEDGISTINFGSVDDHDLDPDANPISLSSAPQSFEKWLRVHVVDMDTSTAIDNIRVYASDLGGGYKLGEALMSNLTMDASLYSAVAYPGTGPVNTKSSVATAQIPESEPIQANIGIGGALSGQLVADDTYSDYIVLQLQLSGSTPVGAVSQKVITIEWDEQ